MHHIGPYRIETLLGKGRRGFVYKGTHEGLGRQVAIKALSLGQGTDPEEHRRILSAAQAQIRIQHQNIVSIYDLIEDQGQVFVAMEYVEGTTLDVLLEKRKGCGFPSGEGLDLFAQVLAALEHAHREGVTHHNVKPANLMVCKGQVRVMDFAMALFRQSTLSILAGSATYMSPEQLLSTETDHRTDLYSAAIVLYEMLAGRHPFQAATELDMVQCHLGQVPPDLKTLVPDLPTGVSETVSLALKKDPRQRFQTAGDFLRALQEGVAGFLPLAPELAASPTSRDSLPVENETPVSQAPAKLPAPGRDRQRRLVAASCILVAFGLLGSYGLWKARYRPPPPSRVREEPKTPFPIPSVSITPEWEELTPSPDPPDVVSSTPEPAAEPPTEIEAADPPPMTGGPDPEEIRRREVDRLREEVRQGIQTAEAGLQAEDFDAAEVKLDGLMVQVQRHPEEFPEEIARIQALRRRLTNARVAAQARQREIELQQAQWERRLQQIKKLMEEGRYPEADNLARDLGGESGVPETVAEQARELSTQAKEELRKIWGDTKTGPTKNKIRRPPDREQRRMVP